MTSGFACEAHLEKMHCTNHTPEVVKGEHALPPFAICGLDDEHDGQHCGECFTCGNDVKWKEEE